MSRWLKPSVASLIFAALVLTACGSDNVAQFWRPISEPNIQLPFEKAQQKLTFDLSQCKCGIYPTNVPQPDVTSYQHDRERLAETSVTVTPNDNGECMQRPSLVVSECMRDRGWEVTNCSGRMPLPGGGSLCAAYALDQPQ
jgi:hypothetical protein